MKPINSETTGFQPLVPKASNLIGTQRGATGAATLPSEQRSGQAGTPGLSQWPMRLQNCETISSVRSAAAGLFRKDQAAMTEQQLSSLRQLAEEMGTGRRPDSKTAMEMASVLIGCFRARDFADAKHFAKAMAALFQKYPEVVGLMVSNPVEGLPSDLVFPPSIAEVKSALEKERAWGAALGRALERAGCDNATV